MVSKGRCSGVIASVSPCHGFSVGAGLQTRPYYCLFGLTNLSHPAVFSTQARVATLPPHLRLANTNAERA